MEKTQCELFAGVGGFRLGMERASKEWKTVWFSQWEPGRKVQWAHDCYVHHFGDIDENTGIDIRKVDKKQIPDHNLLTAGFPCQDYSVARPRSGAKGLKGQKGTLWWEIQEVLEEKRPSFVLMENVDRLLKSPSAQRGRDFGIMLACLAGLGYRAEWRVINAADYGAGQRRRRVFIFAWRDSTVYGRKMAAFSQEEILEKEGFFATVFPALTAGKLRRTRINWENLDKSMEEFQFLFENTGYMENGEIVTGKTEPVTEPSVPLGDMLEKDVPESYFLTEESMEKWTYLKGAKRIERTSRTGYQYTFSEGAIAFPDSLDKPARTMLTSEATVNRSSHVVRDPRSGRLRRLTPVEAERIQGFDDGWTDTGMTERARYFCMGNALVVPLITRMGKKIGRIFDEEP